jgi:hypothetical protein
MATSSEQVSTEVNGCSKPAGFATDRWWRLKSFVTVELQSKSDQGAASSTD